MTEFAMGMLDTSTGLLKALPEKPLLSRRGSVMAMDSSALASMIGFPDDELERADWRRILFWF